MPGLRKVPQVMFSNDRDETTVSFLLRCFFFLFFFDVTEGEKQGNNVDSICGVIKREMVAALGFEWWKNTMQPATRKRESTQIQQCRLLKESARLKRVLG